MLLEKEFTIPAQPLKPLINLALGEVRKEEGFGLPPLVKEALVNVISSDTSNGYSPSIRMPVAREAISK